MARCLRTAFLHGLRDANTDSRPGADHGRRRVPRTPPRRPHRPGRASGDRARRPELRSTARSSARRSRASESARSTARCSIARWSTALVATHPVRSSTSRASLASRRRSRTRSRRSRTSAGTINVVRALTREHVAVFGSSADVYGVHSRLYDRAMREDDLLVFENGTREPVGVSARQGTRGEPVHQQRGAHRRCAGSSTPTARRWTIQRRSA